VEPWLRQRLTISALGTSAAARKCLLNKSGGRRAQPRLPLVRRQRSFSCSCSSGAMSGPAAPVSHWVELLKHGEHTHSSRVAGSLWHLCGSHQTNRSSAGRGGGCSATACRGYFFAISWWHVFKRMRLLRSFPPPRQRIEPGTFILGSSRRHFPFSDTSQRLSATRFFPQLQHGIVLLVHLQPVTGRISDHSSRMYAASACDSRVRRPTWERASHCRQRTSNTAPSASCGLPHCAIPCGRQAQTT
jgi:hypothetical protein